MKGQNKDNSFTTIIKMGDKEALSALYLEYYDQLTHYGSRINNHNDIVEECIQDLFLYIYEAHDRLGMIQNVKAYLFVSLRRRILEKIKADRNQVEREFSIASGTDIRFTEDEVIFTEAKYHRNRETLLKALNQLTWRQREAIYLRYYNGLSTKEIAQIMGGANQTILNTLYQALKKIRSNIQVSEVDPV